MDSQSPTPGTVVGVGVGALVVVLVDVVIVEAAGDGLTNMAAKEPVPPQVSVVLPGHGSSQWSMDTCSAFGSMLIPHAEVVLSSKHYTYVFGTGGIYLQQKIEFASPA